MRLSALLEGWPVVGDAEIQGLSLDSRRVKKGDAFLACCGEGGKGHDHIPEALARGAAAVIYDSTVPVELPEGVAHAAIPDLGRHLPLLARRFYPFTLTAVAVTGTNGKTTCAHVLAHTLPDARAIGTLTHPLTTPDGVTLCAELHRFSREGVRYACLEASSHGLRQGRLEGIPLEGAIFTYLGRDHLDYHGTMEDYAQAKARLFEGALRFRVINGDDPFGRRLLAAWPGLSYGLGEGVDVQGKEAGNRLEVRTPWGRGIIESPLLGRPNAYNLLACLGACLSLGMPLEEACLRLSRVPPAPGRLEAFRAPSMPLAVVDYAHTPEALALALETLRGRDGRLWCVFGAGGERDRGKRPLMGRAAEAGADQVILTDDNPRGEDGEAIIRDILSGMAFPERVRVERDRRRAILWALQEADARDTVLIAGKGHETHQQVGGTRLPFSDRALLMEMGYDPRRI